MAIEKKYFVDINLQGNKLVNGVVGNNADMTKAGSFRYNSETNHLEYFDGEVVRVITNATELNELATTTNASITDLQTQINNVLSNVDGTALNSLAEIVAAFQQADNDLNGAITTLANAASTNLDAEIARATAAESTLQSNIDGVASDLAAETAARITAVSNEAAARVSGDEALQTALDAEIAAREAAITAESSARTTAIENLSTSLNSGLDAEIARATAAEATLTSDLAAEVANREAAIAQEVTDRNAAIDARSWSTFTTVGGWTYDEVNSYWYYPVTHNLNSNNLFVSISEMSSGNPVEINYSDNNGNGNTGKFISNLNPSEFSQTYFINIARPTYPVF
jgi:hypothetical protein